MYRPLVISKDYCWEQNAAGRVDRDFWGNSHIHDIDPVVFCSDWKSTQGIVDSNSRTVELKVVKELFCTRAVQSLVNRCPIPDFRNLPDVTYFTWGRFAKKEIERYIKKNRCDYIDSLGMPHGSHMLALKLKRQFKLPWVARFYDPWTDNQQLSFKFKRNHKIIEEMERKVAETADLIIHNNTHIAKLWCERYGSKVARKIKVIPMVFDSERIEGYKPYKHQEGRLILSHIGNLYGVRNAHNLVMAIDDLLSRRPELRNCIRVNMVGWVPNRDVEMIKALGLFDVFSLPGRLPESECIHYFNESDLYISIDGEGELDLNYPSKLLKYFYFRRPILGLTLNNSVAAEELDKAGHFHVDERNVDSISKFIEHAFYNYEELLGFDSNYYERFSPYSIVSEYKNVIEQLL